MFPRGQGSTTNFIIRDKRKTEPQNIHMESEEEEAGDVMAGEPLSDEGEVDAPGDQLRSTSAAYLLRMKEMHNLSQTAVDDIVQSTNTLVSTAVKSVCVNIANQLQNIVHEDDDVLQNITWQTLFEQNSQEASPFKDLETENRQTRAYKEMFGLVVSMKKKNTFINTGRLQNIVHKKIMQGAKKIIFTACHSGKLKLAFTSPDVISTSPKNFLFFCFSNSS